MGRIRVDLHFPSESRDTDMEWTGGNLTSGSTHLLPDSSMLFVLFQLGKDRYALPAREVVEVIPLVHIRKILKAPKGVAGILSYRGSPIPAIDISEMALDKPADMRLSTRIIVVQYDLGEKQKQLVGLIAERTTQILRRELSDFYNPGLSVADAPYLGSVTKDERGLIQRIELVKLLSDAIRDLLFPRSIERAQ